MLENLNRKAIRAFFPAILLALFLASCSTTVAAEDLKKFLFPILGLLAVFSAIWLLPAGVLWVLISANSEEKKISYGFDLRGNFIILFTPTGKTIPGDPEAAKFFANVWLLAFPTFCLYCLYLYCISLTPLNISDVSETDFLLFYIIFPVFLLVSTIWFLLKVRSSFPNIWEKIRFFWISVIKILSIYLLIWLIIILIIILFTIIFELI